MTPSTTLSRRKLLVKLGLLFNALVGLILAVPVLRYLFSPITRGRKPGYEYWLPVGGLEQFPSGQTRLAVYRNPVINPWDGQTADNPCWVRNLDGQSFEVFAINCAHLGCPVRWFPQSNLFMCPCHGGVYYADGSYAAGPPPRGMFKYSYKIEDGQLFIKGGEMPTTGSPTANIDKVRPPCA
jgi:nitrite reductase/ring-hydroxylating ferredoxin subunit